MEKFFALMLKNPPDGVPTYVASNEFGYPYTTNYFTRECYCYSISALEEDIEIYDKLNIWSPKEGLTRDNVQIVEITLNFKPIKEE